jgi:hypothetical protein
MLEFLLYDLMRKIWEFYLSVNKDLISQILLAFHVQNQLWLYMKNRETLFVICPLNSKYLASCSRWHTWRGIGVVRGHAVAVLFGISSSASPASSQRGRHGFGWALCDDASAVSVAASPRHQTRWGSSSTDRLPPRSPPWTTSRRRGKTIGTPPRIPHLEFQGEPNHHDAPLKVLPFHLLMCSSLVFPGYN